MIEAPDVFTGVEGLYANNLTEFPNTINTLKRFNLYPELVLGVLFRGYKSEKKKALAPSPLKRRSIPSLRKKIPLARALGQFCRI